MRRVLGSICAAILLAAIAAPVGATPIRPDIRKLIAEPPSDGIQFVPARAGWNGPEAGRTDLQLGSPIQSLSPTASARELRLILVAAAIPDVRILLAIVILVLLLRQIRKTTLERREVSNVETPQDTLRPAA